MPAENFIDSNIFVYMFDRSSFDKYQQARELVDGFLQDGTGCISYQVVQETLNVVGRIVGPDSNRVVQLLDEILFPLWQVDPSESLYRRGLQVQTRYGFSFYDSLIVAAALEAGCTTLYSEDMQDGQRIEGLTITNPFAEMRTE